MRPGDTARRSGHFVPGTAAVVGAAPLPRPAQAPSTAGEGLAVPDRGLGVPGLALPPDGPQPASARATTVAEISARLLRRLAAMPSCCNLSACTAVIPT